MKLLFITCGLFIQSMLLACGGINQQVYSGKIEYSLNPTNPFDCTATITLDFDINETLPNDSIWVDWNDGNVTAVHAVSITRDSVASAQMGNIQIYTHVYTGNHIYTALSPAGYYLVSFQKQFRLTGVSNIGLGNNYGLGLYLVAHVSIDTAASGQYKPLAFPPVTIGFGNFESYSENGLQQVADGTDSVSYSLVTPLVPPAYTYVDPTPVPEYQLPAQFCTDNGLTNSSFTINAATGNVSWSNPCLQGVFTFSTLLSKYRNRQLISSVMREQNIYVIPDEVNSVEAINANYGLQVYPNPAAQLLSGTLTGAVAENTLEIVAPDGRVLAKNIQVKDGRFQTDISGLAAGIYFLRLHGTSGPTAEKFIKQ